MGNNTTEHLLADIELLREHLGIGQWLLYGGIVGINADPCLRPASPERVAGIILVGVTMTRPQEID